MTSCKRLAALVVLGCLVLACAAHPTTAKQTQTDEDSTSNGETSFETTEEEDDTSTEPELAFNKRTKIAIIGGGPAGLFAARQLQRAGYKRVTVFETSADGPRVVHSELVDGHWVDYTTRYLPNANPEGQGLYPPLQAMIDEYGLATQFVSSPITYVDVSSSTPATLPFPHIFADFFTVNGTGASAIVSDLVWGFEVLRVVYAAPGVTGCYAALGVPAGTSFEAWANIVNKPAFTRLAAFTNDAFLGGPATTQDVCSVLKVRTHFMPGDIAGVLRSFGLTDTTPLPISDALRSLLAPTFNPSRKLFVDGYKNFFTTMIQAEDLNVQLGTKVISSKRKLHNRIKIRLENGQAKRFHKVIIATRPAQALEFLKGHSKMKSLLAGVESTPVHVHAFHTTASENSYPTSGVKEFSAILYPFAGLLATSTMPAYAFAINKEHDDSSLVIAIGYANNDGSTADEEVRAQQAIGSLGYTTTDKTFGVVAPYPAVVPATVAASGWFAQVSLLQGDSGYYFIGEAFSGYGVPSVLEETTRVISEHFLFN